MQTLVTHSRAIVTLSGSAFAAVLLTPDVITLYKALKLLQRADSCDHALAVLQLCPCSCDYALIAVICPCSCGYALAAVIMPLQLCLCPYSAGCAWAPVPHLLCPIPSETCYTLSLFTCMPGWACCRSQY